MAEPWGAGSTAAAGAGTEGQPHPAQGERFKFALLLVLGNRLFGCAMAIFAIMVTRNCCVQLCCRGMGLCTGKA
jgi:hypothetical protein